MRRRRLLATAALAATAGCSTSRTPTATPTPFDYRGRFETTLAFRDVEPTRLVVDGGVVRLAYGVDDATEEQVRETVRAVANAYAITVGYGWEVDRLRATVTVEGDPVVRYRVETEWAERFNRGGTAGEFGEKIAATVERVAPEG
ncbi:hypothetical protein [Halorarius halobius]|uniref:hypothetical protein n=1 Tax=Halorarius halobius TaxID=2962671 RepID=UPI0020CFDEC9|nr:hypothetical protein [Halorarius halobius]